MRCSTFRADSAGRALPLIASAQLARWWPRLSAQVPGATPNGLDCMADRPVDLTIPTDLGPQDTRRLINAYLHRLHLRHDTLSLHAAALAHPGSGWAVLLLGGHGAGKTLTALALTMRGWRVMAGDVTLLDAVSSEGAPQVLGGTSAFVVRRTSVRRWFPQLGVEVDGPEKFDLSRYADCASENGTAVPVRLAAAAVVDVDGDLAESEGHVERIDAHTAATVWLRASSHLLDRMLEQAEVILRQVEDAIAASRRVALVRELARTVPLSAIRGSPEAIAGHVERLAAHTG